MHHSTCTVYLCDQHGSITISCIQIINHETLNIEIRSYLLVSQRGTATKVPREKARDTVQIEEHMHKRANVHKSDEFNYKWGAFLHVDH